MANVILENYKSYASSKNNFEIFHNQVINMPRPTFYEIPDIIKLMKSLASYILLIDSNKLENPILIKDIYRSIFYNYKNNVIPSTNRSIEFENRYLNRTETFEYLYSDSGKCGRMWRHYAGFFSFFGYFKTIDEKHRIIDLDALNELVLSDENYLFDILRNRLFEININNNLYIKKLNGIEIDNSADYKPVKAILRYLNEINRKATDFEISVLLGRIDEKQKEDDILHRAINVGKCLPLNREDQIKYFFGCMGWKNSTSLYEYSTSQYPWFKFKPFLILMHAFNLIDYDYMADKHLNTMSLTSYGKELVKNDIPMEIIDLNKLLELIDDESTDSNKLADMILRKRTDTITNAIKTDGELVCKLNIRNIKYPIVKNNKRVRSKLIMELAKIKANYLDEVTQNTTFIGKNGKNYVEAHHIIEFNGENGPDITDNLICLGPQNHSLIHHGSYETVEDFYNTCKSRGVFTFDRWKNMVIKYQCLTKEHVNILLKKKIISSYDAGELYKLIDSYGISSDFIKSLSVPTE